MSKRLYLYPGHGEGTPHYLDRLGTIKDLAESGMTLIEGLRLGFWADDENAQGEEDNLLFEGTIHFDSARQQWYALIDWSSFKHESEVGNSKSRALHRQRTGFPGADRD